MLDVRGLGANVCFIEVFVTIECSLAVEPERCIEYVVVTDQDTDVITVCFTLSGSSDDFIVHLK